MRRLVVILVIVLCLGALFLPVTAVQDDGGNRAGPAKGNPGQSLVIQGTPGAGGNQTGPVRENSPRRGAG